MTTKISIRAIPAQHAFERGDGSVFIRSSPDQHAMDGRTLYAFSPAIGVPSIYDDRAHEEVTDLGFFDPARIKVVKK